MIGKYYVYMYSHPLTHVPFYIGKGNGRRYKRHLINARNIYLRRKIEKLRNEGLEPQIDKVFFTDDEDIAYQVEADLIRAYGLDREGGLLCNFDKGTKGSKLYDFDDSFYKRLGTVNDTVLAKEYGCSKALVSYIRRGMDIKACNRRVSAKDTLPDNIVDIIGTKPDTELAREFKVNVKVISDLRNKYNIPPYVRFTFSEDAISKMGTLPDADLADLLGVSEAVVTGHRNKLGILSYKERTRGYTGRQDPRTYHFKSDEFGDVFMTRYDFCRTYGVKSNRIGEVISGKRKTASGWTCLGVVDE
jgi:hypothetical protein